MSRTAPDMSVSAKDSELVGAAVSDPVVIVGAGQAGIQTAASLRQAGFAGPLTVVGDEKHAPYERPPLSKTYLKGEVELTDIALRPSKFFTEHDIDLRIDRATEIHAADQQVELASGTVLPYEHLVLATGAQARALSIPGADAKGVVALHTANDAIALRERLKYAEAACVIGGGFIGLEFAAIAATRGMPVTVVEQCERTMTRVASPTLSSYLEDLHRRHDVRLLLNNGVNELLQGHGQVCNVQLRDGTTLHADLVVAGVGVTIDGALARTAGLQLSDQPGGGIVVDEYLRTSYPSISAVGDCACFPCSHADDALVRLESVQNAADHARAVAARLTGSLAPYQAVPWFWSDQFDARVQIAGITVPHDEAVIHGDPDSGCFSIYCFRSGGLVGVESINRPGDHVTARRILARGERPAPQDVADPDFDPKTFARRARATSTA